MDCFICHDQAMVGEESVTCQFKHSVHVECAAGWIETSRINVQTNLKCLICSNSYKEEELRKLHCAPRGLAKDVEGCIERDDGQALAWILDDFSRVWIGRVYFDFAIRALKAKKTNVIAIFKSYSYRVTSFGDRFEFFQRLLTTHKDLISLWFVGVEPRDTPIIIIRHVLSQKQYDDVLALYLCEFDKMENKARIEVGRELIIEASRESYSISCEDIEKFTNKALDHGYWHVRFVPFLLLDRYIDEKELIVNQILLPALFRMDNMNYIKRVLIYEENPFYVNQGGVSEYLKTAFMTAVQQGNLNLFTHRPF